MESGTVVLTGRMRVPRPYTVNLFNWADGPLLNWKMHQIEDAVRRFKGSPMPSDEEYTVWVVEFGRRISTSRICAAAPEREAVCGDWSDLVALARQPFRFPTDRPIVALDPFVSGQGLAAYVRFAREGPSHFGVSWGNPDRWAADCLFLFVGP